MISKVRLRPTMMIRQMNSNGIKNLTERSMPAIMPFFKINQLAKTNKPVQMVIVQGEFSILSV